MAPLPLRQRCCDCQNVITISTVSPRLACIMRIATCNNSPGRFRAGGQNQIFTLSSARCVCVALVQQEGSAPSRKNPDDVSCDILCDLTPSLLLIDYFVVTLSRQLMFTTQRNTPVFVCIDRIISYLQRGEYFADPSSHGVEHPGSLLGGCLILQVRFFPIEKILRYTGQRSDTAARS